MRPTCTFARIPTAGATLSRTATASCARGLASRQTSARVTRAGPRHSLLAASVTLISSCASRPLRRWTQKLTTGMACGAQTRECTSWRGVLVTPSGSAYTQARRRQRTRENVSRTCHTPCAASSKPAHGEASMQLELIVVLACLHGDDVKGGPACHILKPMAWPMALYAKPRDRSCAHACACCDACCELSCTTMCVVLVLLLSVWQPS